MSLKNHSYISTGNVIKMIIESGDLSDVSLTITVDTVTKDIEVELSHRGCNFRRSFPIFSHEVAQVVSNAIQRGLKVKDCWKVAESTVSSLSLSGSRGLVDHADGSIEAVTQFLAYVNKAER